MKAWRIVIVAAVLVWLALSVPKEQRGLDSVAADLQSALENDPVCAVILGWEEPAHRI